MKIKIKKVPYTKRTDVGKIEANWNKTTNLLKRKEYSGAIVRAATAVEIAANYVIRKELLNERNVQEHFVDSLLIWANGVQGKFSRIILPIFKKGSLKYKHFHKIKLKVEKLNGERNSIVHSGQFKSEKTANNLIEESKEIIEALVNEYEPKFKLKDL